MMICVVGAKERCTTQDEKQVGELLDKLSEDYPSPTFVTMLTHTGVGKFVKAKCLEKRADGHFRFQLIAVDFRLYATQLSQSELSQVYIARNASPFELADVFVYFASNSRRGTMEELIQRAVTAGRPHKVFLPGEPITTDFIGGKQS